MIRIYCSTSVPTKLEAARKFKATLSDILGSEVIVAAEETVRAQRSTPTPLLLLLLPVRARLLRRR